ncbi:peptidyl-tRNA hydrolase domain-like protein, partial [Basidiobolus meristosporus CBS 931.73]
IETFDTSFNRSSGPGGQNVNKVATKVEMRFVLDTADWLPEYVRGKLNEQNRNRINKKGEFVITSDRTRSQVKNADDCVDKLYQIILKAGEVPKEPDQATVERVKKL